MEMKQSICDKDCFHCRFSDCVNHYGPYTEAKDIKKALNGQKKSRPRDWHHEERQAKISYLYIKPKQEVCQMDDKELMIYLMKRCLELEKEIEKQKLSGDYWFRECERLKNEQKQQ